MALRLIPLIGLAGTFAVFAARAVIQQPPGTLSAATDPDATTQSPTNNTAAAALPSRWSSAVTDPLINATQVWRFGARYFHVDEDDELKLDVVSPDVVPPIEIMFPGINADTGSFLRDKPLLKPAVWYGCWRYPVPYENGLERALHEKSAERKLQALVVLMRIHTPSSVALQRKALDELLALGDRPSWKELLTDLDHCFIAASIAAAIRRKAPVEWSETDNRFCWSIRAAGVMQIKSVLPRLAELSVSDNLETSLSAELSIEDFHGPEADAALKTCLLAWQNDAAIRAGRALLLRNKRLLNDALVAATPPDKQRCNQGLLLAKCDNPAAVPILCATVPRYSIIDRKMFDEIGRLALPEHAALVAALLKRVRGDQLEMANAALKKFRERSR